MREVLATSGLAGGFEYTVSVFPPGHRAGDHPVMAEKVTLVMCLPVENFP
jgi:hypothetical protein